MEFWGTKCKVVFSGYIYLPFYEGLFLQERSKIFRLRTGPKLRSGKYFQEDDRPRVKANNNNCFLYLSIIPDLLGIPFLSALVVDDRCRAERAVFTKQSHIMLYF